MHGVCHFPSRALHTWMSHVTYINTRCVSLPAWNHAQIKMSHVTYMNTLMYGVCEFLSLTGIEHVVTGIEHGVTWCVRHTD